MGLWMESVMEEGQWKAFLWGHMFGVAVLSVTGSGCCVTESLRCSGCCQVEGIRGVPIADSCVEVGTSCFAS
jgi:hypothetical protein